MTRTIALAATVLLAACSPAQQEEPPANEESTAADLIATEESRLAAFVEGDWELLDRLHADDFELINPGGQPYTKAQYLDPMTTGDFQYLVFEPVGEIRAAVAGDAGAVRYQSRLSVRVGDQIIPEALHRHTDYYERRDGQWQVVFSQATAERAAAE